MSALIWQVDFEGYRRQVASNPRKFYSILMPVTLFFSVVLIAILTFGPGGDQGALMIGAAVFGLLAVIGVAYLKHGRGGPK